MEDLTLPNVTHGNRTREEEDQEIRESLSRRLHTSRGDEDVGGATLTFWDKYFELQVSL